MHHTPGPWTVSARHGKRPATIVLDANKNEVCGVYAASHLIAAAPALLACAIDALETFERRFPDSPTAHDLRAAIRTATMSG